MWSMNDPEYLISGADREICGDLRMRFPQRWDDLAGQLGWSSDGVNASEHVKDIDVLSQSGQILIDGNHLFLHSLKIAHRGIEKWNASEGQNDSDPFSRIPRGYSCPYEPIQPRLLSYIAAQLMHRAINEASYKAVRDLESPDKRLISTEDRVFGDPDWIIENIDSRRDVIFENLWEIIAFDARLMSRDDVIKKLDRWETNHPNDSDSLDWHSELIRRGQLVYRLDDSLSYTEAYNLKNDYISDLEKNYLTCTKEGVKKLRIRKACKPYFMEKQVDTLMTLGMSDAAANPYLDWVCIVTNDSDFVPAMEKLIKHGKTVIWLCVDSKSKRSKEITAVVGDENAIGVQDLFRRLPDGKSLMFYELFLQSGLMAAAKAKLRPPDVEQDHMLAPWSKSYWEIQQQLYEMDPEYLDYLNKKT